METKEELMNRILKADEEQNGSRDLEKVSLSKALEAKQIENERLKEELERERNYVKDLDDYAGRCSTAMDSLIEASNFYCKFQEVKQEVDSMPDFGDLEDRLYELENKTDEYEITDTVVESMTFESAVEAIVDERLQELTFKVTVEE